MTEPTGTQKFKSNLIDAAQAAGIKVDRAVEPVDRYIKPGNLRFHFLDWGNEHLPNLVFIHGFAQQAHTWDFAALAFNGLFRILSLDLRGHGDSDWSPTGEYRPEDYLSDLNTTLRAIGIRKVLLCGLSLGGRLAFQYASTHHKVVQGLIVVDAAPTMQTSGSRRIRQFVEGVDEWDSFEEMAMHVAKYARRRLEHIRGSLRNSSYQRKDGKWTWKYDSRLRKHRTPQNQSYEIRQWEMLKEIQCPTLFVRGAQSDVVSQEVANRAVKTVPGAKLEIVESAGHLVPGDNPSGFAKAIRPFLEGLSKQLQVT